MDFISARDFYDPLQFDDCSSYNNAKYVPPYVIHGHMNSNKLDVLPPTVHSVLLASCYVLSTIGTPSEITTFHFLLLVCGFLRLFLEF